MKNGQWSFSDIALTYNYRGSSRSIHGIAVVAEPHDFQAAPSGLGRIAPYLPVALHRSKTPGIMTDDDASTLPVHLEMRERLLEATESDSPCVQAVSRRIEFLQAVEAVAKE